MEIRSLIRAGFISFAIVIFIVGSITLLNLYRVNSAINTFSKYKIVQAKAIERIFTFISKAHYYSENYLLTRDEESIKYINLYLNNTREEIKKFEKLIRKKEPELLILPTYIEEFDNLFNKIVRLHKENEEISKKLRFLGRELEKIALREKNKKLLVLILQARRQEKNFMIFGNRKLIKGELSYIEKFEFVIKNLYKFSLDTPYFKEKVKNYQNLFNQFVKNYRETDILLNNIIKKGREIESLITSINIKKWKEIEKSIVDTENLIKSAQICHIFLIFFVIIAVGFGLFLSNYIANLFYKPMENLARAMKKAQYGDLTSRAEVFRDDEIGRLAKGFNSMMEEIEKREKEIKALQKQLIQSEKLASLGEIAAGIAHEINNPLGGILIYSNLLLEDMNDDNPIKEDLKKIVNEVNRCKNIVKGLLDFARQSEPKIESVDINKSLQEVLKLIEKQALFHNIEIKRNFAEKLPNVKGDASQLQQVFLNILINAGEAMPKGGILYVETGLSKDSNFVEIKFKDTGCGIKKENLDKIYDPFFTTKPPGKGTGLGLSVSYGIIKNHNGIIDVESEEGKGTTFTIKLRVEDRKNEKC